MTLPTEMDRRDLLKVLGVTATSGLLLGCPEEKAKTAPAPAEAPKPAAAPPPAPKPAEAAAAPAAPSGSGDGTEVKEGLDCKSAGPIDDTSKQFRKALQYKEHYDVPEKRCGVCLQFEAKKFGDCGGCKLFTGPVNPAGACLSFAAKPS